MNGSEFKSERLVILVEPSRKAQIEEAAKDFRVNGQPSSAAVVRAALDLFFAQRVHSDTRDSIIKVNGRAEQAA